MKLELAICVACGKTGCEVKRVNDSVVIQAVYSSKVKDRIKIQPGHMVAIDIGSNPPEVVWRWIRATVIEVNDHVTIMDDMEGHPGVVSLVPELLLDLKLDDEVWVCGTGQDYEVHGLILDGKPVDPDPILRYITPIIEGIYQQERL
jgi:hypothetical protein